MEWGSFHGPQTLLTIKPHWKPMGHCKRHQSKWGATTKLRKLVKNIQSEWEEVSVEMIEVLIATMSSYMKAVIKANGGSTRW